MQMIIVEGNIGAGKSTLTKKLAQSLNAKAFYEPVETNPYLEKYYQDPQTYALPMQFYLMSVRYDMHLEGINHIWRTGQTCIFDRSIYGDYVFAKKNWLDGNMSDLDFENYNKMRKVMFRSLMIPHKMLVLKNNPEKTLENIRERSRGCEVEISIDYLRGLNDLYNELSAEMRAMGTEIIELDWNQFKPTEYVVEKLGLAKSGANTRPEVPYPLIQNDKAAELRTSPTDAPSLQ